MNSSNRNKEVYGHCRIRYSNLNHLTCGQGATHRRSGGSCVHVPYARHGRIPVDMEAGPATEQT
jgi:hypothetical protein